MVCPHGHPLSMIMAWFLLLLARVRQEWGKKTNQKRNLSVHWGIWADFLGLSFS